MENKRFWTGIHHDLEDALNNAIVDNVFNSAHATNYVSNCLEHWGRKYTKEDVGKCIDEYYDNLDDEDPIIGCSLPMMLDQRFYEEKEIIPKTAEPGTLFGPSVPADKLFDFPDLPDLPEIPKIIPGPLHIAESEDNLLKREKWFNK